MEDGPPKEEKPVDAVEDDDDEEEGEDEANKQEDLDKFLLAATRENRVEDVQKWIEKRANPLYEENGWNAMLWAACNGNEKVVRALIKKETAVAFYLNQKGATQAEVDDAKKSEKLDDEQYDPFVKLEDVRNKKYTPLHWASYQGHIKVVWILLKIGMSPLDQDKYGNTAVHQAAAAGNLKVLECFLSRGVNVDKVNARKHTPMDLATEPETKKLLNKAVKTKNCEKCKDKFDFKNIRYYCS
jgi:ankyrin repeat protein